MGQRGARARVFFGLPFGGGPPLEGLSPPRSLISGPAKANGTASPLISKRNLDGRQGSRRPYFARVFARVIVRIRRARLIPTYISRRSSSTVSSAIER